MNVVFLVKYYSTEDGVNYISAVSEVHKTLDSAYARRVELSSAEENLNEDGTEKHVYFVSAVKYVD